MTRIVTWVTAVIAKKVNIAAADYQNKNYNYPNPSVLTASKKSHKNIPPFY